MVIIRAPHGQRSRGVKVVKSGRGIGTNWSVTLEVREKHQLAPDK